MLETLLHKNLNYFGLENCRQKKTNKFCDANIVILLLSSLGCTSNAFCMLKTSVTYFLLTQSAKALLISSAFGQANS
jgi:hypothetical protein